MVGVESGQSQDSGGLGEVRWLRTSVSDSVVWVPLGPLVRVREEYPPFIFFDIIQCQIQRQLVGLPA